MTATVDLQTKPSKLRRVGLKEILASRNDSAGFMLKMAETYGGIASMSFMGIELHYISDPDMVRELVINHPQHLHKDFITTPIFKRIVNNGIVTAEDEHWKRQRKIMQPAFHAMRIQSYAGVMALYTQEMVDSWQTGQEINLTKAMKQLTQRIIAKTMYNVDVQEQLDQIDHLMYTLFTEAESQLKSRIPVPAWVTTTPSRWRQARAAKKARALLQEIIDERRASGDDKGDLLSMLLQVRYDDGTPMSDEQLLDECITMFVAGHETTASTMIWVWYLLTQHSDIATKIYAEVDSSLGKQPVTFDTLADMPYGEMVVKEALRIYPPAAGFVRTPLQDIEVEGHLFRKGSLIALSIYAMHHLEHLFPQPERFWPERFGPDQPQPHRYAYVPFGAGSRSCMGNMFAMMEAQVILATMAKNVVLELTDGQTVERDSLFTMQPKQPLWVRVNRRH